MSKIALSGDASGTGTFTIASPNSNSNFTLTLPQATTTVVGTDATQTLTNKTINGSQLVASSVDYAKFLTTDWTNSKATDGYQKLPSGVIVQWGTWNGGAAVSGTNSFSLAFPTSVFLMVFGTSSNGTAAYGSAISNSQYNWNRNSPSSNSGTWVAFGH